MDEPDTDGAQIAGLLVCIVVLATVAWLIWEVFAWLLAAS